MAKSTIDLEALAKRYQELFPRYEKLGRSLLGALAQTLTQQGVELFGISFRIKDFDSFRDKVERGTYKDPFEEMSDICGLRIVHFYKSHLPLISETIAAVAEVLTSSDQEGVLKPEKFGFRELVLAVKLKEETLKQPGFEDLAGLKVEIQIRTAVMNTWGEIQKELAYHSQQEIPAEFSRKFFQLNTFFDLADDMLDDLKKEKERYSQKIAQAAKAEGGFQAQLPINLDNLQAFLDFHFPKRKKNLKVVSWLLVNIITPHQITMKELVDSYDIIKDKLPALEKGLSGLLKETYFFKEKEFERTQGIMLMTLLSLTDEDYWNIIVNLFDERHWEKLLQFFHDWRAKLADKEPARKNAPGKK